MDFRTRFRNCLKGEPVDRLPFITAFNGPAINNSLWTQQGYLSEGEIPEKKFGFDCAETPGAESGYEVIQIDQGGVPRRKQPCGILPLYRGGVHLGRQPGEGRVIYRYCRSSGRTCKIILPDDPAAPSARIFVAEFVHSRDDWAVHKRYFKPSPDGRYPEYWDRFVKHTEEAHHPIGVRISGLFSEMTESCIGLAGTDGLLLSLYDRPDFIREMTEHFTEFIVGVFSKALREASVDFVILSDHISGDKNLPFISPGHFREFFLKGYFRLIEVFRRDVGLILYNGGYVEPYLPMLLDAGINGLAYVPRQMDMERLIKIYGNNLCFMSCIDKFSLLGSRKDIEDEVDRRVNLAGKVRLIPNLNELLAGVSFESYCHYARYLKSKIFRKPLQ